ncbi:MAG: zinc-binding dehydrogenase [Candidatus Omnitrophica bacterium]|nr:zinc-binding dehydrogenase [Candidatus Omnitrophota bacterium]
MKTIAAVLSQINKPLNVEELNVPELKKGQLLIRVAYSGICHSQLNEIRGLKGEDKFLPHTLGHEGSGLVEAVGEGVSKVKVGDKVVLTWIKASGLDAGPAVYIDKTGKSVNSGAISTFLTLAVISENRVVKMPEALSLKDAALLGCAIPTGAGIVINTVKITKGSSIAIFGMGGIGFSALLAAKMKDAATIIAVDISDEKLERSKLLGATHTLNVKNGGLIENIMMITQGKGVDYAIESAGKKESMECAFKSVRDKGGLCVIAGNLSLGDTIQIDPFDLIKGRRIIGTWGGETQPDRDIPMYAEWAVSGKLNLKDLIWRVYDLKDINEAVKCFEKSAIGRVLIKMGEF